jgi:hypothetical protein
MFISPIRQRVGHTPQQDPKIAICAQPKLIDHPGLRKARAADLTKYRRSAVRDIATLSTIGMHERTFFPRWRALPHADQSPGSAVLL